MLTPKFDAAIIPCTATKNPAGVTPLSLYKGGPFSLMMRHAQQRASEIFIMSAHYGLLRLDSPVRYYEAYLPDLNAEQRKALLWRIRGGDPALALVQAQRIISYLPRAYFQLLAEALPALQPKTSRPFANLPMLTLYQVLSNEIKNYGTNPSRR